MNHPVFSALFPVVLLIAVGFLASKARWIRAEATKDLSNLVFMVLAPALLFRTMSTVHVETLNFAPVALYFLAVAGVYAGVFFTQGRNTRAAVLALAACFGNNVMIGIPLVGLAYGQAGLVVLLTLISVHSLVLLTSATVVLEFAQARQGVGLADAPVATGVRTRHRARTVVVALRNGFIHPVPLPIVLGLAFAQTGLQVPDVVDRPLQLLGSAMGPVALLLVGASLAQAGMGSHLRSALATALNKILLLPAVVFALAWFLGLRGLELTVMTVAGALPIGANVFLFAQRYQVAQELVTTSIAASTVLGLLTITLVMYWVGLAA